jgi:hypothetical protein
VMKSSPNQSSIMVTNKEIVVDLHTVRTLILEVNYSVPEPLLL